MLTTSRPFRSVLYIPASNERAVAKAAQLAVDAIIFDLEDAVAPTEKAHARQVLAEVLAQTDFGNRARLVRVNGLETDWGRTDLAAFASHPGAEAILVPKVGAAADLDAAAAIAPEKPLWAMMETACGILNAAEIAAHPRLAGMVMGTNDLAKELGARTRPDRLPLQGSLALALLAARANGRVIIDGVYNSFRDDTGLKAECEQGRDLGFDGKTLIHPAQVAIANSAFAPSETELDLAARQIAAMDAAMANGQGVAVVDGRIVESLHIVTARRMLDLATAIAEMERK